LCRRYEDSADDRHYRRSRARRFVSAPSARHAGGCRYAGKSAVSAECGGSISARTGHADAQHWRWRYANRGYPARRAGHAFNGACGGGGTAAAAASSSASMAARRPLAAARAAPRAGAQDSGALARALAAASVLARAAPAAYQAPRADASHEEDGEEELSDDQETLREALSQGGRGWVIMGNPIPYEWTDFLRRGAYRKSSRTAQPIINSQLHDKMEELGDAADTGRRQVPVPSGGRGRGNRQRNHFAREVRRTLATVAARVGNEFDVAYDGVTPHILITMPRTPAQLAHTDTGLYLEEEGSGATLLSVYVSFEEGTFVDVWPRTFGGAGDGTESVALPPPLRVAIPVGSCLIVGSDLVDRGTENLRARGQLRCIHAYSAVHVDREHMAYAAHMSFLSQYI